MRFVIRRLLLFAAALFGISIIVFAALRVLPGDVASVMAGLNSPPERVAALRSQLGLDRPLIAQYADWIGALLHGDFGTSILTGRSISAQVGEELAWNGFYALLFVVLGFLAYISARFEWKFAVAAIITTLHDVIVVTGWFALTGHEFNLTVLAGILSVMGYSINDTIVVFDRVRENFKSMRLPPAELLNKSINQTLSRTVITSFVAFLTVFALYLYGGGSLQGMAEAQIVGIVLGTVSTIFVACPLLLWLGVSKQDLMPKARDEEALARRP